MKNFKRYTILAVLTLLSTSIFATHTPEYWSPPFSFESIAISSDKLFVAGQFDNVRSATTGALLNIETGKLVDSPVSNIRYEHNSNAIKVTDGWIISNYQTHQNRYRLALVSDDQKIVKDWTDTLSDIQIFHMTREKNSEWVYLFSSDNILSSQRSFDLYRFNINTSVLELVIDDIGMELMFDQVDVSKSGFIYLRAIENENDYYIIVIDIGKKKVTEKISIVNNQEKNLLKFVQDKNNNALILLYQSYNLSVNSSSFHERTSESIEILDLTTLKTRYFSLISQEEIINIYFNALNGQLTIAGEGLVYGDSMPSTILQVDLLTNKLISEYADISQKRVVSITPSENGDFQVLMGAYSTLPDGFISENFKVVIVDSSTMNITKIIPSYSWYSFPNAMISVVNNDKDIYFDINANFTSGFSVPQIAAFDIASGRVLEWKSDLAKNSYVNKIIISKDGSTLIAHGFFLEDSAPYIRVNFIAAIDIVTGAKLWSKSGDEIEAYVNAHYQPIFEEQRVSSIDQNKFYRFKNSVYNLKTGIEIPVPELNSTNVSAFSSSGAKLYFADSKQSTINIFDLEKNELLSPIVLNDPVADIKYVDNGDFLLVFTTDNRLLKIDSNSLSILYDIKFKESMADYFTSLSSKEEVVTVYSTLEKMDKNWRGFRGSSEFLYYVINIDTASGEITREFSQVYSGSLTELNLNDETGLRFNNTNNYNFDNIESERVDAVMSHFQFIDTSNILVESQPNNGFRLVNVMTYFVKDSVDLALFCQPKTGIECDSINYSVTEASSPYDVKSATIYTSPIKISKDTNIRFYAKTATGEIEKNKYITVFFDLKAPIISANEPAGSYKDEVVLTFDCNDIESYYYSGCSEIYYTLDGTTPDVENYNTTKRFYVGYTQEIIRTNTRVNFIAQDYAGRFSELQTIDYIIDTDDEPWYASVVLILFVFLLPVFLRLRGVIEGSEKFTNYKKSTH